MSAPCIILASLPSFCQILSKLVEIRWSSEKTILQFFSETRCTTTTTTTTSIRQCWQLPHEKRRPMRNFAQLQFFHCHWQSVTQQYMQMVMPYAISLHYIYSEENQQKLLPRELLFLTPICTKSFVGWGFAPRPYWGSLQRSPDP